MRQQDTNLLAGRYELGPLLGAGGMGAVYRAHDVERGCDVAVKLLRPDLASDPVARRYMYGEQRAIGKISHGNVVAITACGTTPEHEPYLVMEIAGGRSLRDVLCEQAPLTLRRVSAIIRQVLAGLHAIHAAGFIHGDVKADNVLVDDCDRVTLIDLGLMRSQSEVAVRDGFASGTPDYMAPEVIRGEGAVLESDIYAVGSLLYELLTGSTPFGGGTSCEILMRHLDDDVVPPSLRCPDRMIPAALERVIMRALEKSPAARFHSARAFAHAISVATPHVEPESTCRIPVFSTAAPTERWQSGLAAHRKLAVGTQPPANRKAAK